ncbi:hypothetical protein ACP70R_032877 [Stipagrostis hirtigluma subsp. patula]
MSSPPVTPTKKKPVDGSGSGNSGDGVKGDGPRPVVAERVFTNSGGAIELPMLTTTNYHVWSSVMHVCMEALGLWGAVETDKVERREDRRALAILLSAVPTEMKAGLAAKESAKEAWAAVRSMRMGDERVRDANAQRLLKVFENLEGRDGETVDAFAMRLGSLVAELRELGETMEEVRVVKKMLRVVPKKYGQVAVSIEMMMDLKAMPLEELIGRLHVAEGRAAEEAAAADGGGAQLLLTEEQWEARRRQRGNGREKRGGDGGHEDSDDDRSTTSSGSRRGGSRYRGRCFDCGERGHMARNCPRKKKERALLCDADDEPALL